MPRPDLARCDAIVWIRDTYRRTGRGPSGFEMHYNERPCARKVLARDQWFCWQHQQKVKTGRQVLRWSHKWKTYT